MGYKRHIQYTVLYLFNLIPAGSTEPICSAQLIQKFLSMFPNELYLLIHNTMYSFLMFKKIVMSRKASRFTHINFDMASQ